ncbi:MAG: hypothetical protein HQL37_06340 [Alphaproteobacteria bacterium]|nr:hypothetical protein [Alphaproteobacteria bacterium]
MINEEFRDAYAEAMGFDPRKPEFIDKTKSALQTAHKNSDEELEHYWKRVTYFVAFQAAAFTVVGILLKSDSKIKHSKSMHYKIPSWPEQARPYRYRSPVTILLVVIPMIINKRGPEALVLPIY